MDHYHYILPGPPLPLKRARCSQKRFYDPQSKEKETAINYLKFHEKARPIKNKPLSVQLEFYMPIPKSLTRKKNLELLNEPHTKRPDLDNLIKFILDVGNNLLWDDDCLIFNLQACKIYSNEPRTEIKINVR